MTDYQPIFAGLFPEGSHGGQCIAFAHKLLQLPTIGDTLQQKINSVNKFGIPVAKLGGEFRVGDLVITNESLTFGHGGVINCIPDPNTLRFSESNFNLDEKVHHTRTLPKNSSHIIGVIRGSLAVAVPLPPPMPSKLIQHVLVLNSFVPDQDNVKLGVNNWLAKVAQRTAGGLTIVVDYADTTAQFNTLQTSNADGNVVFADPQQIVSEGHKFEQSMAKEFDVICLIYDDNRVIGPKPNHPVDNPVFSYGFNVMSIPLSWVSSLMDTTITPVKVYPDAIEMFFSHELSHADFFLVNAKSGLGLHDRTHDYYTDGNPHNYPSPIFNFLDYLMELQPYWTYLAQGGETNDMKLYIDKRTNPPTIVSAFRVDKPENLRWIAAQTNTPLPTLPDGSPDFSKIQYDGQIANL